MVFAIVIVCFFAVVASILLFVNAVGVFFSEKSELEVGGVDVSEQHARRMQKLEGR